MAGVPLLIFRGQSLEVLDLAAALGQPCDGEPPEAAVIAWEKFTWSSGKHDMRR